MENEYALRIAQLLEYTGESQVEFAEKLGVTKQYVTKLLKGEGIGLTNIASILKAMPEVNARWLILGEGNMIDSSYMMRVMKLWVDYEEYIPAMTQADKDAINAGKQPTPADVVRWGKLIRERKENIEGRIAKAMQRAARKEETRK